MTERSMVLPKRVKMLTVILFWVTGSIAALFTFFPIPSPKVNVPATQLMLAVLFATTVWFTRLRIALFHRIRLPIAVAGLAAVALLVYFSGGSHSYFAALYLLLAVVYPLFFAPLEVLGLTVYTGLLALLPAIYDFDPTFFRVDLVGFGVFLFVSFFMSFVVGEFRTKEKERHHLQILAEASRLSANLNLASTLKNTVSRLRSMVDGEACVLYLIDEDSAELFAVETDFDPAVYGTDEDENTRRFRVKLGQGLTGWVAQKGEPLLLGDAERDSRAQHIPGTAHEEASYIVAPVAFDQRVLGVLRVSRRGLNRFGPNDLSLVTIFANQAAVAITNAWLYESTKQLALRDNLTGLYNSRYLVSRLQEEVARSKRYATPLSMLFLDCDGLKTVNDAHGHPVGDQLIKEVSEVLRSAVRTTDIVIRYAGDEFIILMPQTGSHEATQVAERIRHHVAKASFCSEEHRVKMTVSIGVATVPEHASTGEELFKAADDALYAAKGQGRNNIHLSAEMVGVTETEGRGSDGAVDPPRTR